jgi:methionyl-tRNA synthetase
MARAPGDKARYITTPIYYVNALPHIGHSYTTVAADVIARFWRLQGHDVLFATGTDEHGQKVFNSAQAQGKHPQDFVDEIAAAYKAAWSAFHVSNDVFIRTTDPCHVAVVQGVFGTLRESGDIYLGTYEGWYCVPCESYFREDELVEGRCPDCNREVERVAQSAYFFHTSKYAEPLLDHIRKHPEFLQPEARRKEVVSFIEGGLLDACVSRKRSEWDIPVPGDESQSIYVWFDALVNYLTVAGYLQVEECSRTVWPPDLQLMGKDILPRFHATLWSAMLLGLGLPLPQTLFAHGWWVTATADKSGLAKMSKSTGNVVDPLKSAEALAGISGADRDIAVDAVRYYMLREVTFGLDGTYSMDNVIERFNADLANDLGNLLNRSLPLVHRWFGGKLPVGEPGATNLVDLTENVRERCETALGACDFRRALEALWELIAAGNKYLDERAPWTLHREGRVEEAGAVLRVVLDVARCSAIGVAPFMPFVAEEIWSQLGLAAAGVKIVWADFGIGRLPKDLAVGQPSPIFPRIDMAKLSAQEPEEPKEHAPVAEPLSFDDFRRVDLRAGKVLSAETIAGADKLLKLMVDVGESQPRQIVAGLAPRFGPEHLVGKTVVVIVNLAPATIREVESNGMILAAGEKEPVALAILDPDCPPGTKVR